MLIVHKGWIPTSEFPVVTVMFHWCRLLEGGQSGLLLQPKLCCQFETCEGINVAHHLLASQALCFAGGANCAVFLATVPQGRRSPEANQVPT